MEYRYQAGEQIVTVRVEPQGAGYTVRVDNGPARFVTAHAQAGALTLTVDGRRETVFAAAEGARQWVALAGRVYSLETPAPEKRSRRSAGAGRPHDALTAQMPGVIRQVLVTAGERVERGQTLLMLEAMKMEIKIAAPHAGQITAVAVRAGETVQRGQLLVDLAPEGD